MGVLSIPFTCVVALMAGFSLGQASTIAGALPDLEPVDHAESDSPADAFDARNALDPLVLHRGDPVDPGQGDQLEVLPTDSGTDVA